MADDIKVTELAELTKVDSSLASVTELRVEDISDTLVEGKEAVVTTEIASPPAA